jgi:hypothetical protein
MNNHPGTQVAKASLNNSLAISDAGIHKALRYLATDSKPMAHTPLVPAHVCDAVIARYSETPPAMGPERARLATLNLLAGYPYAFKTKDGEDGAQSKEKLAYMRTIAAVFAQFPERVAVEANDPVNGLPGRLKFLPTAAELTEALTALVTRDRAYAVVAQWHKVEGERRAVEAMLDAQIAAERNKTPEERAALVHRIRNSLPSMNEDRA